MQQENYKVDNCKDYSLIKLPRKVTASDAEFFNSALEIAYEQGHNKIVIDCSDLRIFNAVGFVYLLVYRKKMSEKNGEIKMINIFDNNLKERFEMVELNKLVSIES